MPWSAKAQDLLKRQYYPTVAAAKASAEACLSALDRAPQVEGLASLRAKAALQRENADAMGRTINGYCWDAASIEDYKVAPFHILAAEGQVFTDRTHLWHMETLGKLTEADPILKTTGWRRFDGSDSKACEAVAQWWLDHTAAGGEGMVI